MGSTFVARRAGIAAASRAAANITVTASNGELGSNDSTSNRRLPRKRPHKNDAASPMSTPATTGTMDARSSPDALPSMAWVHVWVQLSLKKTDKTLLSDTESMKLFLVRDQEAGGSNPLAPTTSFRTSNLQAQRWSRSAWSRARRSMVQIHLPRPLHSIPYTPLWLQIGSIWVRHQLEQSHFRHHSLTSEP
jgi:hypothetical protein